jgi:membrane protein
LRLMANIGQRFVNGQRAPTATELADALDVPTRLIHQIAHTLVASGLLVEVAGAVVVAVPEMAYAPARPLEKITCHDILTALRAGQGQELATREEPAREEVRAQFERIQNSERDVSARITVFDLATKVPAA